MKRIIQCFQINILRNRCNFMSMVISMLMIPLVVLVSFYVNSRSQSNLHLAVVGSDCAITDYLDSCGITYQLMEQEPRMLDLYKRLYAGALLTDKGIAVSYEGGKVQQELEQILDRSYTPVKQENSFPRAFYLNLSILLIQAVLNMKLFINDRRNSMKDRLFMMGVSRIEYLISFLLFNWISMFVPYSISNIICNSVFLEASVVSCLKILLICFVTTGLFSAIALLICVVFTDNASVIMIGNLIACFTALISGMFGEWSNPVMKMVGRWMPQSVSYQWAEITFRNDQLLNSSLAVILFLFAAVFVVAVWIYNHSNQRD